MVKVERFIPEYHVYWLSPEGELFAIDPLHHYEVLLYSSSPIRRGWTRINSYVGSTSFEVDDPETVANFLLNHPTINHCIYVNGQRFHNVKAFIDEVFAE